jgi:hypothetical protein
VPCRADNCLRVLLPPCVAASPLRRSQSKKCYRSQEPLNTNVLVCHRAWIRPSTSNPLTATSVRFVFLALLARWRMPFRVAALLLVPVFHPARFVIPTLPKLAGSCCVLALFALGPAWLRTSLAALIIFAPGMDCSGATGWGFGSPSVDWTQVQSCCARSVQLVRVVCILIFWCCR